MEKIGNTKKWKWFRKSISQNHLNADGTIKIGDEYITISTIYNPTAQHQLLANCPNTPTISASTTTTNLSSMDTLQQFGSNKRLGENLRNFQPEIEPLKKKAEDDDQVYNETTTQKMKGRKVTYSQILTAVSVSIVSFVIGFVTAYTAPAQKGLEEDLGITNYEYSWLSGFMPLAALVGALIGGQLIEFIGRKWTIVATAVMFVISWILTALATNVYYMYIARAIVGLSVGIASLTLPVYLGETIQPEVRGILGLLPTAFGNMGIVLCFTAGSYLTWYQLGYLGIALPVPFLILMFFIPETPRWYVSKDKVEDARKALQYLRGREADVQKELDDIENSHQESVKLSSHSHLSDIFKKANLKPLVIALGLMFFQQLSGINAIIFYTTQIFELAGSSIPSHICTIIVGVVNFIATFIATILIDKVGRKVLLYISGSVMTLTIIILGIYFYLLKNYDELVESIGWLPLTCLVLYVLGFSLGFGPVPWLMLGEILPAKVRGSAASIATAFNWACTFIVTKTFQDALNVLGESLTFWIFGVVCLVSLIFIYRYVPETRGKSLEAIERKLARRPSTIKTPPSVV
ncbi:facilitated trehalose transporter Tret1-2 homolog isoform X3 [Onthophagus taurus]|uniref:facilitated trehalose transporter Tret1-2 homolog isoform X3 n=1 Tax=Onthophagus taurus TaxID=166361 RepID=UPI000C2032CE|nr:facilitated trehalose transporter Tret1-2 homolog isoform X3 [Onthophagus taurus]